MYQWGCPGLLSTFERVAVFVAGHRHLAQVISRYRHHCKGTLEGRSLLEDMSIYKQRRRYKRISIIHATKDSSVKLDKDSNETH